MADMEHKRQVPLVWEDVDQAIVFANQFLIQHQKGEFVMTVGQVIQPPVLGTIEEREEQISRINYVPVRILGRYGFSRQRLVELISVLQDNLEKHDQRVAKEGDSK